MSGSFYFQYTRLLFLEDGDQQPVDFLLFIYFCFPLLIGGVHVSLIVDLEHFFFSTPVVFPVLRASVQCSSCWTTSTPLLPINIIISQRMKEPISHWRGGVECTFFWKWGMRAPSLMHAIRREHFFIIFMSGSYPRTTHVVVGRVFRLYGKLFFGFIILLYYV